MVTFKMHAMASKTFRDSFWMGGVWSNTVFQLEATLRPSRPPVKERPFWGQMKYLKSSCVRKLRVFLRFYFKYSSRSGRKLDPKYRHLHLQEHLKINTLRRQKWNLAPKTLFLNREPSMSVFDGRPIFFFQGYRESEKKPPTCRLYPTTNFSLIGKGFPSVWKGWVACDEALLRSTG